jgi:glycosyltransferase involved in cell wall biosynthesis
MSAQPWLSVLSPIYNGEAYLSVALDSIVIQGDNAIECIAVDGESTDATLSILKSYQDKLPIKILQRERSTNWIIKTNHALSHASGEYVCFLHHDDLWFKDRLKIMKQLTERFPEAVLLLHPSHFLDNKGNNLGTWNCPLPAVPEIIKPDLMIERLLVQNFISILGPVFKRKAALEVGSLDESLWYTADWDFWLKMAACGDSVYYPKPLSGFRVHPSSQTVMRSSGSQEFRKQLETVATRHFADWQAAHPLKQRLRKVVNFSMEANIALAGAAHGQNTNILALLIAFVRLGPSGTYRYLRDSRLWERVWARIKAQIGPFKLT